MLNLSREVGKRFDSIAKPEIEISFVVFMERIFHL
jgi:hypothetical protein